MRLAVDIPKCVTRSLLRKMSVERVTARSTARSPRVEKLPHPSDAIRPGTGANLDPVTAKRL